MDVKFNLMAEQTSPDNEKKELLTVIGEEYTADAKKIAEDIWNSEDTLTRLIDLVEKYHTGDRQVMKFIFAFFVQGFIENIDETTYLTISAKSGAGKTHLINTMTRILDPKLIHKGGITGKYLMHLSEDDRKIWDKSMVILDDYDTSDALFECIKICSSRIGNKRPEYNALVGIQNKPTTFFLPERLFFLFAGVDINAGRDSEQVLDRCIVLYVDTSPTQHEKIRNTIIQESSRIWKKEKEIPLEKIGEFIWLTTLPKKINVFIPSEEAEALIPPDFETREIQQVMTYAKCIAFFHQWRGKPENWGQISNEGSDKGIPYILATKADIKEAVDDFQILHYERKVGDMKYKISAESNELLNWLIEKRSDYVIFPSIAELARQYNEENNTTISAKTIERMLLGRKDRGGAKSIGLHGIIPGLECDNITETTDKGDTRKSKRSIEVTWDPITYKKFTNKD